MRSCAPVARPSPCPGSERGEGGVDIDVPTPRRDSRRTRRAGSTSSRDSARPTRRRERRTRRGAPRGRPRGTHEDVRHRCRAGRRERRPQPLRPPVVRPEASASSASVASAAAREKRVGGRNSRTSSHALSGIDVAASVAAIASAAAVWRIAVQTVARAAANARSSPRAIAASGGLGCGLSPAELDRASREHDLEGPARARDSCSRASVGRAENELRLGIREGGANVRGRAPRRRWRRRRRRGGEHKAHRREAAEDRARVASLLRDLHLEPRRRLRHLAGDGGRPLLRLDARAARPAAA